jgi:dimethylargininase
MEEYFRVPDFEAHNINEIPDRQKTAQQHTRLKSIMAQSGAEVIEVTELSGHPNSVFTRDIALATPKGFVELRMGLESRRGEESWMARILESMGEPRAGTIREPGTLEGGDILLAEDVAFVGASQRTNLKGVEQISKILKAMDYEVRLVPVPDGYLHLGGAMSVIAPDRIVCCRSEFDPSLLRGVDVVDVPKRGPSTGNVICLAPNEVLGNVAENKEALDILDVHGVNIHPLDLSEFRKGAGGPTCLILPVERA